MDDDQTPPVPGVTHHAAAANGVRLHYVTAGPPGGEPLILLHGWQQTWYEWRKVLPALAAAGYAVLAPDLRGFGGSEKPAAGYDAETLAEDVRALAAQVFGPGCPACVVGHDMGALPALALAGGHPAAVRRLAYLEEPVPGFGLEEMLAFTPEDAGQAGGAWWFFFNLMPDLPEALVAGRERLFLETMYRRFTHDPASIEETAVAEYARAYAAPGAWRGGLGCYRAIFETAAQNRRRVRARGKLAAPVLALGGEASLGGRVREMVERVAADVHGGALARCGHFIPEEQPEELVRQLLAFFREDAP